MWKIESFSLFVLESHIHVLSHATTILLPLNKWGRLDFPTLLMFGCSVDWAWLVECGKEWWLPVSSIFHFWQPFLKHSNSTHPLWAPVMSLETIRSKLPLPLWPDLRLKNHGAAELTRSPEFSLTRPNPNSVSTNVAVPYTYEKERLKVNFCFWKPLKFRCCLWYITKLLPFGVHSWTFRYMIQ